MCIKHYNFKLQTDTAGLTTTVYIYKVHFQEAGWFS